MTKATAWMIYEHLHNIENGFMYILQEVLPLHCSYIHVTMWLPTTVIPNLPKTDQLYFIRKDTDVAKSTQSQFSLNAKKKKTLIHMWSNSSRLSPLLRTEIYPHDSPSATAESLRNQNRDDDYVDVVHERERNWDSPRPIWHKRPRDMESDGMFLVQ